MRNGMIIMMCSMTFTAGLYAADNADPGLAASISWQPARAGMTHPDYLASVENNQRYLKQELQLSADRLIHGTGGQNRAYELMGAAVVAAVTDTRLNFGARNGLGMVFRDTTGSDRSMLFEYRKDW